MNRFAKRMGGLFLAGMMTLSLAACGGGDDEEYVEDDEIVDEEVVEDDGAVEDEEYVEDEEVVEDEGAEEALYPNGTYMVASVSSNGQTVTAADLEAAAGAPVEFYIAFVEDGTGEMALQNGPMPFTWDESTLYFEASEINNEMTMSYTFDGVTVSIDDGNGGGYTFE